MILRNILGNRKGGIGFKAPCFQERVPQLVRIEKDALEYLFSRIEFPARRLCLADFKQGPLVLSRQSGSLEEVVSQLRLR